MEYPQGIIFGTDLCARLRQAQFKGTIFIRSANDDPVSVHKYIEAGADGWLTKDGNVAQLARKIVGDCARARQMRAGQ